jgi:diguanylate cyclase
MHSNTLKTSGKRRIVAIYSALMLLSLLAFLGILIFMLVLEKNQLERQFVQQSHLAEQNLQRTFAANETILDGFAAYIAGTGANDNEGLHRYVQTMMNKYSHLYMFQAAQRIKGKQIHGLERRQSIGQDSLFEVWYFDGTVKYARDDKKPEREYFPIIFADPIFRRDMSVLGLDIQSIPFVQDALQQALHSRQIALSQPIELFEGDGALVMLKPGTMQNSKESYVALLVVKIDALRNSVGSLDDDTYLRLSYPGRETIFQVNQPLSADNTGIFGALVFSHKLSVAGQYLHIDIRRELHYQDFNLLMVVLLFIMTLLVMVILTLLLRVHLAAEKEKDDDKLNLYRQANFDELTGLANRHYFQAQVQHVLASARRRNTKIGFMYLDLNDFKAINDNLGHAAGDKILMIFAGMIFDVIRSDDLAARLGGDEFVIMLDNLHDIRDMQRVVNALRERCALVSEVNGQKVKLQTSIGTVMFPDDGDSVDDLLHAADQAMYSDKSSHKH